MTFEDTIRVADLKTRAARFVARARGSPRGAGPALRHHRIHEAAAGGDRRHAARRARRPGARLAAAVALARPRDGRQADPHPHRERLPAPACARWPQRWRRGTLRYREENARIEDWLARIERLAPAHYPLAVELARAQRLIKGYGETHERGWSHFETLLSRVDELAARPDGASFLARLHEAALADEEGAALARELAALAASS